MSGERAQDREAGLPPPVSVELGERVSTYWRKRLVQHTHDTYAGVRMSKFPEDLRVYEHLLWESRANVVIEIGTQWGGSALWFRDRLMAFMQYGRIEHGHVYSIDLSVAAATRLLQAADPGYARMITLIEGDVRDPAVADRVARLIPPDSRCFVVEDSEHVYDTTWAALNGFAGLVPVGGYFVVEDGCVDIPELRAFDDWPQGVLPALEDWRTTQEGSHFAIRQDLERYGLTCHPRGFLQRVASAQS